MKAKNAEAVKRFQDIPNIGPAMEADFALLGITKSADLKNREPLELYETLNKKTGVRQDPCVLDVFMAAVDFMNGVPARPWWHYTAERKKRYKL